MPVVTLYFDRVKKILGKNVPKAKLVETLPFIGLDIEDETSDHVNVEYSPNRPDYSTDYGIITGLQGLLGIKLGMPILKIKNGKNMIKSVPSVSKVRPYVTAIEARNGKLDDETIRQIITMQEDLHNGLGRRRKKASIGIHDLEKIKFPLYYKTVNKNHSFVPLEADSVMKVTEILEKTETRNLLVEVTATDKNTAEGVLAVIANTLQTAGFQLFSIKITGKNNATPR